MGTTSRKSYPSKLPNAPLVETVVEFHWSLPGDNKTPAELQFDPGYPMLVDNFTIAAEKHGFTATKKFGDVKLLMPHSVGFRYFKGPNQPFPIWQIGPGIFAANESTTYGWDSFKKMALDGFRRLFEAYPSMKTFKLRPLLLELRYIDSFDSELFVHEDVIRFLNEETALHIEIPSFVKKKQSERPPSVNLVFEFPLASMKKSKLHIRIANAVRKDRKAIVMESKVSTNLSSSNIGNTSAKRIRYIDTWMEDAHSVTSPFFREFVSEQLMEQFRKRTNAKSSAN